MLIRTFDDAEKVVQSMEQVGAALYAAAARVFQEPTIKAMFQEFEKQEERHMEVFADLFRTCREQWRDQAINELLSEDQALFRAMTENAPRLIQTARGELVEHGDLLQRLKAVKTPLEVIDIALDLERNAIRYYEQLLKNLRGPHRKAFTEVVNEEKKHVREIIIQRNRLTQGH